MALRNQPYLPLYVQDFMTDERLMECSASATGIYIRLMCVMHKSETYGTILLKQKDKQNDKQVLNFAYKVAKFLPYDLHVIVSGIEELLSENVIQIDGDLLIQKRMVKDGLTSDKRALAGSKGGKTTMNKQQNFAQANSQANSENESDNENEVENKIEIGKESLREKPKIPFEEIIQIFNSVCIDLPRVKSITATRKKLIEARVKEYSFEILGDIFRKVAESDFLSGRKSDWKASFDWIMNPTNFVKILEDNYKNNKNGTGEKSNAELFSNAMQSETAKNFRFK